MNKKWFIVFIAAVWAAAQVLLLMKLAEAGLIVLLVGLLCTAYYMIFSDINSLIMVFIYGVFEIFDLTLLLFSSFAFSFSTAFFPSCCA